MLNDKLQFSSVETRLFLSAKKRGLALLNGLRENLKTLNDDTENGGVRS